MQRKLTVLFAVLVMLSLVVAPVGIAQAQKPDNAVVSLQAAEALVTTGKILGTLYDSNNNPITWTAVQVRVVKKSNGSQVASTTSNTADGSYKLSGLPLNVALAVIVSDEDPDTDGYSGEYYNDVDLLDWAENIRLTSGNPNRGGVDFKLTESNSSTTVEQLTFNTRAGRLLNDVNIRKAIAYGANRQDILYSAFLPNNNLGGILHTMVTPGIWYQAARSDLIIYNYNPTTAQDILTAAGWTDTDSDGIRENASNEELELDFKTTTAIARGISADLFTQQMQAIGIRITVTTYPASDFFSDDPAVSPLAAGDFDIAEFAWVFLEFDTFIGVYNTSVSQNFGGYTNSTLDGYYTAARNAKVAGDPATFQSNALLWQQTFADDLPALPLFTRIGITAVNVPTGTDVTAISENVTATFANVSSEGSFGIVSIKYNPDDLPGGYKLGGPNIYEVGTNAGFDTANVCINYDTSSMTTANEYFLRMFHLENLTTWVEVTTSNSLNVAENQICGDFTSFSDVALMYDDSDGGTISGTVRDESSIAITGTPVTVSVQSPDGQVTYTSTDSDPADGTYTISGLPLNTDLMIVVNGNEIYGDEYYEEAVLRSLATVFNFNSPSLSYSNINFTLPSAQPGSVYEHFTFNVRAGRFLNDPIIRQAIAFGTDRERILNKAFLENQAFVGGSESYNYGVVLNSLTEPGYWSQPSYTEVSIYPYDLTQATSILDAAGIVDTNDNGIREKDGNDIILDFKTTPAPARIASSNIFTENMAAIGIQVNVTLVSAGEFFSDDPAISPIESGDFDIVEFAWVGADQNLDDIFPWQMYETGNSQNHGGYSNTTVDTKYNAAMAATDRASMLPHVLAYYAELSDNMPSLPLFTRKSVTPVTTATGVNILANLGSVGVTVKFQNATSGGNTAAFASEINPADLPPNNTLIALFEIGSSVSMPNGTGATVCITYDATGLTSADENKLQLHHLTMTGERAWTNIYTTRNTTTNQICGFTGSFSTFAVLLPDGEPPAAFNKSTPVSGVTNQPINPTLSWGTSSGATSYEYCYDTTNDGFCSSWIDNGASTSAGLSGLSPNTTYYWHVRAINVSGITYSNVLNTAFWSFKTVPVPGAFNKTSPTNNALKQPINPILKWGISTNVANYEYCYDTTNNNTCDTSWVSANTTSAALSGLNNNTVYYWQVRAINSSDTKYANTGTWWNFKVVISASDLFTPTDTTTLDNKRPTLDWEDVAGATGYKLVISKYANLSSPIKSVATIGSSYTLTSDLPAKTKLYWRVQATGPNGPSLWSIKWSFTTGNPAGIPVLASPANNALVTDYTPLLNWNNSSLPAGTTFKYYQIQVDDNNDFLSPVIDETTTPADITDSDFTPLSDLAHNTKFYWRVRAVNTVGITDNFSAWSVARYFRVIVDAPVLLLPDNGLPAGTRMPIFDWTDVANNTGYMIQVSASPSFGTLILNVSTTAGVSTYTPATNLPAGKTLYWRVRTKSPNGPSAWSLTFSFTTP